MGGGCRAEEHLRTETEALKLGVIDLIAPDIATLLKKIHAGRGCGLGQTDLTPPTRGQGTRDGIPVQAPWHHQQPQHRLYPHDPWFLWLYFELSNPGAIFPGVAGAICLILAFYALQTLPINYAGLMLIILASGCSSPSFITSHGVLGVGGAVAMLFGSLMLIDSPEPSLKYPGGHLPVVAASASCSS